MTVLVGFGPLIRLMASWSGCDVVLWRVESAREPIPLNSWVARMDEMQNGFARR